MASAKYDIITVGGGLGGAALAKGMAENGANVLVLESETKFRDRVRGELLVSWGVAEAKELGIYESMKAAGGRVVEWDEQTTNGGAAVRRHLPSTTGPMTPRLNFYHPTMQESVLEAAANAGAEVLRGARVREFVAGDSPKVIVEVDGRAQEFPTRLVVGADGRSSQTRKWGGFQVLRNPDQTHIAGVLLDNMSAPDNTSHVFRVFDKCLTALLFPQGNGRVRAYLCYPATSEYRLTGQVELPRFIELSVLAGAAPEFYADVQPVGPLASFNSASSWVEHPYQKNIALIGDAAASTDPMWGQGMALAARDARVLRDKLLSHEDWDEAGHAYAYTHDEYFKVSNTVESWLEKLLVQTGPDADARRAKALPLWSGDPSRRPDTTSSGPDHSIDESVRMRFFGEDQS